MKMLRSWQERVDDMIAALDEAKTFVAGMDYEQFRADRRTQQAVLADLFIVGETASRLTKDAATTQETVPWDRLKALRQPLANGRLVLDTQELWRTIQSDLPELAASLRAFASTPFEDELPSL